MFRWLCKLGFHAWRADPVCRREHTYCNCDICKRCGARQSENCIM
jgi:hypothetical protein